MTEQSTMKKLARARYTPEQRNVRGLAKREFKKLRSSLLSKAAFHKKKDGYGSQSSRDPWPSTRNGSQSTLLHDVPTVDGPRWKGNTRIHGWFGSRSKERRLRHSFYTGSVQKSYVYWPRSNESKNFFWCKRKCPPA